MAAVVGSGDGAAVAAALLDPETGQPVRACVDHLGCIALYLNDDDEPEPILTADGLAAPHLQLADSGCVVVQNKEGEPAIAALSQDGVPVQCCAAADGTLRPMDDAVVIGPDGLAATCVVCATNAAADLPVRAVRSPSGAIFACVFSADGVPLRAAQVKKNVFGPQKGGDGSAVRAGDDRQQLHLAVADSAVVWKAVYEQQQKQQQQVEAKGGKSGKAAAAKMPLAAQNPAQSPQKQAPIGMR